MVKVIVLKVGPWSPSKVSEYPYMRVTFKLVDDEKKYVYLNLTKNVRGDEKQWSQWIPYLKEGNVLDVTLQDNKNNVNQFAQFFPVKVSEINKEEHAKEKCNECINISINLNNHLIEAHQTQLF